MALIDKYTGQVSYKGLIARYVSKKPKRGTRASQGKRVTQKGA